MPLTVPDYQERIAPEEIDKGAPVGSGGYGTVFRHFGVVVVCKSA